jgi:hypothetical protein
MIDLKKLRSVVKKFIGDSLADFATKHPRFALLVSGYFAKAITAPFLCLLTPPPVRRKSCASVTSI